MNLSGIYGITNGLDAASTLEQARIAFGEGIDILQLRCKSLNKKELSGIVNEIEKSGTSGNSLLIINDHTEISLGSGNAGLHIGQQDGDPQEIRNYLGKDKVIGLTINEESEISAEALSAMDYVGLGPLRFTETKEVLKPLLGMEGMKSLSKKIHKSKELPIFAIGGIRLEDTQALAEDPAISGIAVSSAIWNTENPAKAIRQFREYWSEYNA